MLRQVTGGRRGGVWAELKDGLAAETSALGGESEVCDGKSGALQGGWAVVGDEGGCLLDFALEFLVEEGDLGAGEGGDVDWPFWSHGDRISEYKGVTLRLKDRMSCVRLLVSWFE